MDRTVLAIGVSTDVGSIARCLLDEAIAAYRRAFEICRAKGVVLDALRLLGLLARVPNLAGLEEVRTLLEPAANQPVPSDIGSIGSVSE